MDAKMSLRIKAVIMVFIMIAAMAFVPFLFADTAKAAAVSLPSQIFIGKESVYDYGVHNGVVGWSATPTKLVGNGWKYVPSTNTLYLHGSINGYYSVAGVTRAYGVVTAYGGGINIVIDGPTILRAGDGITSGLLSEGTLKLTVKKNLTIDAGSGIIANSGNIYMTGCGKTVIKAQGAMDGGIYTSGTTNNSTGKVTKSSLTIKDMKSLYVTSKAGFAISGWESNINIINSNVKAVGYGGGIATQYGDLNITESKAGYCVSAKATGKGGAAVMAISKCYSGYIGKGSGAAKLTIGKNTKIVTSSIAKIATKTISFKYSKLTNCKVKAATAVHSGGILKSVTIK